MDIGVDIARLKKARRSVRPQDLHRLLVACSFERRFGKGDHWVYRRQGWRGRLVIDPRTPLLPDYVTKAIRVIEEVM